VNPDLPSETLKQYARSAENQIAVSTAIINGTDAQAYLPPLLRHSDAWKAYTEHCSEEEIGSSPPSWLMSEFLVPLGFDQAVVRGLTSES